MSGPLHCPAKCKVCVGDLQANGDALDMLACMMRFDPSERITAAEALQHDFFQKGVSPTPPEKLPKPKSRADAPLLPPTQQAGGALPHELSGPAYFQISKSIQSVLEVPVAVSVRHLQQLGAGGG